MNHSITRPTGTRPWIRSRLALVATVAAVVVMVSVVLMLLAYSRTYVVEANSESVRLYPSGTDTLWRIDGLDLCVPPDIETLFLDQNAQCTPLDLPAEPLLRLGCGVEVIIQRVGRGPVTAQLAPRQHAEPVVGAVQPDCSTYTVALASVAGDRQETRIETAIVLTGDTLRFPLTFRGNAVVGQVPVAGVEALALSGTASLFQGGRFGAGRYLVDDLDLVLGDVVSVTSGSDEPTMSGLIRLAPHDAEGLSIAFSGTAGSVKIDRMRTEYLLERPWTTVFLQDPLILVALALVALISAICGVLAYVWGQRDENGAQRIG